MENIILKVEENKDKVRLDSFIEKEINHLSRSRIQKLLEDKMILVNDKYEKASYKVRLDDQIIIDIPDLKEISALPEKIDLNIVYEDKDIIVINNALFFSFDLIVFIVICIYFCRFIPFLFLQQYEFLTGLYIYLFV